MLSEIAKDKEYLRAAEIIQKAEKNGRRLGFYEPDKDESIWYNIYVFNTSNSSYYHMLDNT